MRVHLELGRGPKRPCKLPHMGCDHAIADGACPSCHASPFKVRGVVGTLERGHDRYTSSAECAACGACVGRIVAVLGTIFGLEEDEAVLTTGRARVY